MPGDSNQLFRIFKTALAALLVFITLVLFALHHMARDNREHANPGPSQTSLPPASSESTDTLFERIRPATPDQDAPSTTPRPAEKKPVKNSNDSSEALGQNGNIIKQRGQQLQQG